MGRDGERWTGRRLLPVPLPPYHPARLCARYALTAPLWLAYAARDCYHHSATFCCAASGRRTGANAAEGIRSPVTLFGGTGAEQISDRLARR